MLAQQWPGTRRRAACLGIVHGLNAGCRGWLDTGLWRESEGMVSLSAFREIQQRVPGRVAALLALVWLGMAVLPCQLLAMPVAGTPASATHAHDGACDSCPGGDASGDCATVAAFDCVEDAAAAPERRIDDAGKQPVLALSPPPVAAAMGPPPVPAAIVRDAALPSCSLQQRYCSFLK